MNPHCPMMAIEEWGHVDRCWTCEPFESHMPSIVAARELRARYVT